MSQCSFHHVFVSLFLNLLWHDVHHHFLGIPHTLSSETTGSLFWAFLLSQIHLQYFTIYYHLSPDIYIFFVTKFTSSHKNSTQVRYINNVMVKMVKSTNTLKATTLKSTSIQLPKLTNKVHWNLFVQSPPFRELESRTSIRNIVVLFYRFVDLDNSRERTRDLWMKGGIFKTEIIKNKIIH